MGEVMEEVITSILSNVRRINDLDGDIITKFGQLHWSARMELIAEACKNYPINVFESTIEAFENPSFMFQLKVASEARKMEDTIALLNPAPLSEICPNFKHDAERIHVALGFKDMNEYDQSLHPIVDPLIDDLNAKITDGTLENTAQRAAIMCNHLGKVWDKNDRTMRDVAMIAAAVTMIVDQGSK